MSTRIRRAVPLVTGAAAIALAVSGVETDGSRTGVPNTATGKQVLAYFASHPKAGGSGAFTLLLAAVAGLFFFGWVRRTLRGSPKSEWLSTVGFNGGVLLAVAALIEAGVDYAWSDVGTRIQAGTAQTLNILQSDLNNMFIQGGLALAMLGFGIAILWRDPRHDWLGLPRWVGWPTIAIGVLAVAGPLVSIALGLTGLWTLGIAVTYLLRGEDDDQDTPTVASPQRRPPKES